MEEPTSSTNGNKMKSPCESNKRKVDKKKKNLHRASAPEQSLKETEKAKYPTLVFYYRKNKKRNSNQLENNQPTESSTDPIKEKGDLDISAGSPQDGEEEKDLVFLGARACLEEHIRSVLYVGDSDTLSKMKTSKSPPSGHIPQSGVFCNSPNAVSN
ncbi:sperm protein associated with the nucleus on the X chromosome N4 isoform X1 [Gorilla gorilla gorilla]|uniref:sperm protein associated with the nucleus on the X chromosome N4 isoform X1 n=1 Tax=Gorilla gorilla gorilla TaxID=9595 RepID=UPI002445CAD6|nr:sperm protein associated with the nucleus on the X chromosome N4 isoform X1 [Gorilla gorilla gorilla]